MISLIVESKILYNKDIYKTEIDSQTQKINLSLPKGKGQGKKINIDLGINICPLLYIK